MIKDYRGKDDEQLIDELMELAQELKDRTGPLTPEQERWVPEMARTLKETLERDPETGLPDVGRRIPVRARLIAMICFAKVLKEAKDSSPNGEITVEDMEKAYAKVVGHRDAH